MKNSEYSDIGKGVGLLLLVSVAAAIGLLTILLERDDKIYVWLSEWQTLIASMFAIVAAAMSIWQISKSDELQEKRHREVIGLSLRADALRLGRFSYDSMREMAHEAHVLTSDAHTAIQMTLLLNHFGEPQTLEEEDRIAECRKNISISSQRFLGAIVTSFELHNEDRFSDIADLLGPRFVELFSKLNMSKIDLACAINGESPVYLRRIADYSMPEVAELKLLDFSHKQLKRLEDALDVYNKNIYLLYDEIRRIYDLYSEKALMFED